MTILAIDTDIFNFINHQMQNSFFDWIMPLASSSGVIIWLVFAAVIFLWYPPQGKRTAFLMVAALLLSIFLVSDFLKEIIERPRPFLALTDVKLLIEKPNSFSFPSGHSANSFACATVIAKRIKPLAALVVSIAFTIGLSRVYVGVHFPFDVVGGAIIGIVCGLVVLYIERIYGKENRPDTL